MPLMADLLTRLQEEPPTTEMELRDILDTTGYDLVMKEPMMEEAPEDMGPEEVLVDEPQPEEVEVVEEVEGPPADPMEMFAHLMPPGMGPPSENEGPQKKVRRMTMIAAHKAMPDKGKEKA
jgi:hypothetical protein